MVDLVETAREEMLIASRKADFSQENFIVWVVLSVIHKGWGGNRYFPGNVRSIKESYFYSRSSRAVGTVEKSVLSMGAVGKIVPTKMWTILGELWAEMSGNFYPQVIHPQSTAAGDKFLAQKVRFGRAFWGLSAEPGAFCFLKGSDFVRLRLKDSGYFQ